MSENRWRMPQWVPLAIVLALSTVHFFVYHDRMLVGPYRVNDDVVQHYLFLFDTEWADDFYARTSALIQPWGYRLTLRFLNLFAEPITISKYGPLLITVLTGGYAFGLLRQFFSLLLAMAGTYLALQFSHYTGVGFMARAFAAPLLAAFAFYLTRDRPRGIAIVFVLCALFYPPALLVNGFILLGWEVSRLIFNRLKLDRHLLRRLLPMAAGALIALTVVLLHSRGIARAAELGDMFDREVLTTVAEFGGDGRVPFTNITNSPTWWVLRYFVREFFGTYPAPDFGLFVLAVTFLLGLFTHKRLGGIGGYLLLLAVVTAGLYELSKQVMPHLFLSDRYVVYPWRIGVPLVLTFLAGGLWALYPRRWVSVVLTLALVTIGTLHRRPRDLPFVDMQAQAPLFDYLQTLPEDAMIVAPPQLGSFIPLFAERSVLLGHEQMHALYFRRYYDYVTPRLRDYVAAMTAPGDSPDRLLDMLEKYGADQLIVHEDLPGHWSYQLFAPYGKAFLAGTREQGAAGSAVLNLPDSLGRDFSGFRVYDVDRLRAWAATKD